MFVYLERDMFVYLEIYIYIFVYLERNMFRDICLFI